MTADANKVTVKVKVTNTGSTYSGKEIVQVYYSAPDSAEAEKEYQELGGFAKTDELAPGESQILTISYADAWSSVLISEASTLITGAASFSASSVG